MYSMTGYGRGTCLKDGREVTVELKSVNHRYLDVSVRLPRVLSFLEETFRSQLSASLSRGHVDVYVNYRNTRSDARSVCIDALLMEEYVKEARRVNETLGLTDDLSLTAALRLPDVSEIREADEDRETLKAIAAEAMCEAVSELKNMRLLEGERLKEVLSQLGDSVTALRSQIALRAPLVVEEYQLKLNERIAQLMGSVEVDRTRLATEVALFADKASIDEELARLQSHIAQYRLLLDDDQPAGRKLDFVVQEMNREFNTIGSKANDAELTKKVLLAKAEMEKIREQIQNIE